MKGWIDPRTGECFYIQDGDVSRVELPYRTSYYCVSCGKEHSKHMRAREVVAVVDGGLTIFARNVEAVWVAMFYKSWWKDCKLPMYAPTDRDWGVLWRRMLGWLYDMGVCRSGVLRTWEVFRADRMKWTKYARPFVEVHRGLYDNVCPHPAERMMMERTDGYSLIDGVVVVQRERIPVNGTWVVDERKFENSFVEVEGIMHDEETPLYLVVHVPWSCVTPQLVWVVGKDRHTGTLFALRVPAQFRYLDSALRWTLSAEPWDVIEEV